MHISPKLAARLPVRIDISWMRGLAGRDQVSQTEPKPQPGADSPEQARLMNQILELNPSASMDFLAQFSPSALGEYLEHLNSAAMPRGRTARRGRPENTPAVTVRTAKI
jgi:hypothetical protein